MYTSSEQAGTDETAQRRIKMNADAKQIVVDAITYIERGWCQNALAKNERGSSVHVMAKDACSWCMMGAIIRSTIDKLKSEAECENVVQKVSRYIELDCGLLIDEYNDHADRTQAQVVAKLRIVAEEL